MGQRPTANLRDFVISLVVWVAGTLIAGQLVDGGSSAIRVVAIVIALGSTAPWARLVIGGIREADEFSRQKHAMALGIGFGGTALTAMLVDWLQRAEFIGPLYLGGFGLLIVWLWWGVGMIYASRHYR
jgi:hypothetical protein